MTIPVFLKDLKSLLPQYGRPQRESLDWLAAAHARAAVTASGGQDSLSKWEERMAGLVRRYSCGADSIGWRRSELADYTHTDWPRMSIFNLHENARGGGTRDSKPVLCGDR